MILHITGQHKIPVSKDKRACLFFRPRDVNSKARILTILAPPDCRSAEEHVVLVMDRCGDDNRVYYDVVPFAFSRRPPAVRLFSHVMFKTGELNSHDINVPNYTNYEKFKAGKGDLFYFRAVVPASCLPLCEPTEDNWSACWEFRVCRINCVDPSHPQCNDFGCVSDFKWICGRAKDARLYRERLAQESKEKKGKEEKQAEPNKKRKESPDAGAEPSPKRPVPDPAASASAAAAVVVPQPPQVAGTQEFIDLSVA